MGSRKTMEGPVHPCGRATVAPSREHDLALKTHLLGASGAPELRGWSAVTWLGSRTKLHVHGKVARPPGADRVCRSRGRAVLWVSLVPSCAWSAWCAWLEDGSEGGALGLGQGWGLGD